MQVDENKQIIYSDTPFGEVPVKIGDGNSLFPEYNRLYFQATAYKYPFAWGKQISWINVVKLPDGKIEVWSDIHPDNTSKWNLFVNNNETYVVPYNINYRGPFEDLTWKTEKYTFVAYDLMLKIIGPFWSKYQKRTVFVPWYNRFKGQDIFINANALAWTYPYEYPLKFPGFPTTWGLSKYHHVFWCDYLDSLNALPGPKCEWKFWPFASMDKIKALRWQGAFEDRKKTWYPPSPFPDIGYQRFAFAWTTKCSPSAMVNWISAYGIDGTDFITYPDTRKFELPTTEREPVIPPEVVTPEVVIEEVVIPEVVTPEVVIEEVVTPEVVIPEVVTPEVVIDEVVTPEVVTPEPIEAPGVPETAEPTVTAIEPIPEAIVAPEAVPTIPEPTPEEELPPAPGVPIQTGPEIEVPPDDAFPETTTTEDPTAIGPISADPLVGLDPIEAIELADMVTGGEEIDTTKITTGSQTSLGDWIEARGIDLGDIVAETYTQDKPEIMQSLDVNVNIPESVDTAARKEPERLIWPMGHPNWGAHIGKLRPAKVVRKVYPMGHPLWGSHFEDNIKIWWLED